MDLNNLSDFPDDLAEAIEELIKRRAAASKEADSIEGILQSLACLESLFKTRTGPRPENAAALTHVDFTENQDANMEQVRSRLNGAARWANGELTRRRFESGHRSWREKFAKQHEEHFVYVIDDENFQRAKGLSKELLEAIEQCSAFKPGHRDRLIRRVTDLIGDLHPRMASLDKLTGVCLDAIAHAQFVEDQASNLRIMTLARQLLRVTLAVFGANAALPHTELPLLLNADGDNTETERELPMRTVAN